MIREACFKITEECPCNCSFCDSRYKFDEILRNKTMTLEQWKNIVDKLVKQGIKSVVISGGEPLLHMDLSLDLIAYLRNKGVYVVLNTSGVLFSNMEILDRIVEIGTAIAPNLIVFSIDSIFEKKHDENRQMPGLFHNVVKSINYIKEQSDISVGIRTVITKNNYRELPDIITYFGELDIDCIKLTNIENDINCQYCLNYNELIEFDGIIKPRMKEAVISICEKGKELELNIANIDGILGAEENYEILEKGLFSPTYIGECECCLQGHFITVQSNGDVLPCCEAEHHYYPILGNLLMNEVEEIITSDVCKHFLNNRLEYCTRCTQMLNYQISFEKSTRVVERR